MSKEEEKRNEVEERDDYQDFPIDVKRDIVDIINDTPSLVTLGGSEYMVRDMRYYSLYRISRLALGMMQSDKDMDDTKIVTALCTDFDAMCEIVAVILCNHLFRADDVTMDSTELSVKTYNDHLVEVMKMKVMNSTFEAEEWAGIVLGAIKSIDLSGFFLLRKSVNTLIDSLLMRKRKSAETASLFTEAQSLRTQRTS